MINRPFLQLCLLVLPTLCLHQRSNMKRHRTNLPRQSHERSTSKFTDFDRDRAEYLVNFSRASYCSPSTLMNWTCIICKDLGTFSPYYVNDEDKAKYSKHVGYFVGYSPVIDSVIVVFRGSDFLINFIQDLEYYKVDASYPICGNISEVNQLQSAPDYLDTLRVGPIEKKASCRVHSGFYDDWLHAKPFVVNATLLALEKHPSAGITVTGHSLGGAIACLGALELALLLRRQDVSLLTFGEPRVGNVYFADFVHQWVPSAIRIVHQDDAVPHLPPQGNELLLLTSFHHHGREVWQTGSRDDEFKECDPAGEDPKCSDSLMPWDRSVEAHKWYIGWPMHC